jgi:hypothetical protein
MSLSTKMFPKSRSTPTHAGGVRKGKASRFAIFESSDEEDAPPAELSLKEKIALNPLMAAMYRGDVSWADDVEGPLGSPSADFIAHITAAVEEHQAAKAAEAEAQSMEEASIWHQSFSRNLEAHCGDRFDLSYLTEAEYVACMTWLYANGWYVTGGRNNLEAYPADLPPRVWVMDRFAAIMEEAPAQALASSGPGLQAPKPKKATVTVPRFCRASSGGVACADAACRYVHADTMPRLNEPCAFGAACGGTDPAKRALCIRMHPGETWDATLVVSRPVATVTGGGAASATATATACTCPH